MAKTGIIRKLDKLFRIVAPREMYREMGLKEHDPVRISFENGRIIIEKHSISCIFCDNDNVDNLELFKKQLVCKNCLVELKSM
jgi:transcriptional pleiotropic regulator of transition state genes